MRHQKLRRYAKAVGGIHGLRPDAIDEIAIATFARRRGIQLNGGGGSTAYPLRAGPHILPGGQSHLPL